MYIDPPTIRLALVSVVGQVCRDSVTEGGDRLKSRGQECPVNTKLGEIMSDTIGVERQQKSFVATWLLSLLLGIFGVDRFYLGKVGTGILKLITFGGYGIWWLIDLILVLAGATKDKSGQPLAGQTPSAKRTAWIVSGAVILFSIIIGSTTGAHTGAIATNDSSISDSANTSATDSASVAPAQPAFKTQTFRGSGDSVVKYEVDVPAVVTFTCNNCSGNTTLETDGAESLMVNEIGAYSGSQLINTGEGSLTTKFTLTADASWTLKIADASTVKPVSGPVSGSGDSVIYFSDTFDTAAVRNVGDSNFVIYAYGGGSQDLVVNEIGSYQGVVNISGPGFVEVRSNGSWTITPQ